jgi:hypothetical protein
MIDLELLDLYQATSKHSHYQLLPNSIQSLLPPESLTVKSRHERERLDYIANRLDLNDCSVADVGGNTGYFSFELLARGVLDVTHIEGNTAHHKFVSRAAAQLGLADRLQCENRYIDFENLELLPHHVVLLLNVLHHVGDDYGDPATQAQAVQSTIKAALRNLAPVARHVVLQLGFNWKGNPKLPIFARGNKAEVIDLVKQIDDFYEVQAIGIASKDEFGAVAYSDLNAININRDDSLGEFLNRPLFVLRSRIFANKSRDK